MKAGLVTGQRQFELVDMPDPEARPGTAVVEVSLCGICGTDLHGYLSDQPYNPAICGHEFSGIVVEVGAGVAGLKVGQRVVAGVAPPCGHCRQCRAGETAWCQTSFMGAVGRDPLAPPHGGFARYVAMDAQRFVAVHDALSDIQAAIIEPATVAFHALRRTPFALGSTVVVQGCGPIGLLCLQLARAAGAGKVVAIDPVATRRDLALRLGADVAAAPDEARAALGAVKADRGADVVFECAGVAPAIQAAAELCRRGGTVGLVGYASDAATILPRTFMHGEITLVASLAYLHDEFVAVQTMIADGRLDVAVLHDDTRPLSEAAEVFAQLVDDPTSAVKVLIDPRL